MILRICLPSGATERVTLGDSEQLNDLGVKIEKLDKMHGEFKLFSDRRFTQPFVFESARHGDMIFIQGTMKQTQPDSDDASNAKSTTDPASIKAAASDASAVPTEKKAGTTAAPTAASSEGDQKEEEPKESKRARAQAELEKQLKKHGTRKSSIALMEAFEALKFKISPQENGHAKAAAINSDAANAFQAYLAETAFSQQRVGYCFGTFDIETETTNVHVIYEPPQTGNADSYALADPTDAGDMTERAHALADMIGLQYVGLVISARPRKCILSAMDVVFAAGVLAKLPEALRKTFIIFVVSTAETGQTIFEAYQLSDLAVEIYEAEVFEEMSKQKPNGGRVVCTEDVLVERKDTKKVPTEFFILNVPIKSCDSWLRTAFTIENRDLTPQNPSSMQSIVRDESIPYHKRLADFHLLLFLSNVLDMKSDMPGLSSSVKDAGEIGEGYRLMIENMASQ